MQDKRFNIIHIIGHDMGRHLGCYGAKINTPNFDRIASLGIKFNNYFCSCPTCSPSRGSILTGLYPHNNGLIGLAHLGWRLNSEIKKLPQYLNELGYETYLIGLQHEAPRGEESSLGYKNIIAVSPYIESCYSVLRENIDSIVSTDRPFFINIGTIAAHRPYTDYKSGNVYNPDNPLEVEVPPYLPDKQGIREDIAYLNGLIKKEDEYIGKIFALLEERDILNSTLLVLTTDHGIAMPRAKGMCYDPGIGTFLIMYMKGKYEGGREYNELLSNVDLLPTYIEFAGGRIPDRLDGRSFLPLINGNRYKERDYIFAELTWHDRYNPIRAVRTKRFKYIRNFGKRPRVYLPRDIFTGKAGYSMFEECYYFVRDKEELYDLEKDPWEKTNIINLPEYKDVADELRRILDEWMISTNDPLLKGDVPPNDIQLEREMTDRYNN
ncbi:sulfatase [bacterium]|nr:sulfatase [bacterium]